MSQKETSSRLKADAWNFADLLYDLRALKAAFLGSQQIPQTHCMSSDDFGARVLLLIDEYEERYDKGRFGAEDEE